MFKIGKHRFKTKKNIDVHLENLPSLSRVFPFIKLPLVAKSKAHLVGIQYFQIENTKSR